MRFAMCLSTCHAFLTDLTINGELYVQKNIAMRHATLVLCPGMSHAFAKIAA
jgi:hypothetical protein